MLVFPWIALILVWIQWRFWSLKKKLFFFFFCKASQWSGNFKAISQPFDFLLYHFHNTFRFRWREIVFGHYYVFTVYLNRLWFQKLKGSYGKRVTKNLHQCDCGDWVKSIDTVFIHLRYLYIQYSYMWYIRALHSTIWDWSTFCEI